MRVLVLCLLTLTNIPSSAVCSGPVPRLVCAEYFHSQVIVQAKLTRSEYIAPENDNNGHLYTMQTERILRGHVDSSFQVWEENDSGRASFNWTKGASYLLFFYAKGDRGWVLDGCGNSGPLEKTQAAVREIADLQKRHGGMIQVAVGIEGSTWSPAMSGAEVNAQGGTGKFSAATNDKGIAEIHVPAGQYSVTVADRQVQPFDLSFDDPRKIMIENGGCAQIQFVKSSDQR